MPLLGLKSGALGNGTMLAKETNLARGYCPVMGLYIQILSILTLFIALSLSPTLSSPVSNPFPAAIAPSQPTLRKPGIQLVPFVLLYTITVVGRQG